jgi:hypothetical protein
MSNGATVSRNLVDKFQTEGLSARSRAACLPRPSLDAICNRAWTSSTRRNWQICRRKRHNPGVELSRAADNWGHRTQSAASARRNSDNGFNVALSSCHHFATRRNLCRRDRILASAPLGDGSGRAARGKDCAPLLPDGGHWSARRMVARAPSAAIGAAKAAGEGAARRARRAYSAAVRPALSWPKRRSI